MSVLYGVTCVASIVLLAICSVSYRKENKWLMWLFLSVAVTNIGYFALSVSPNLVLAMTSNTVAYLGSVYISVFMFLTIASMCKLKIPNKVVALLFCIGVIVFVIATSAWYSDIYYVDVAIERVNNATVLVKTYGVLHPIYKVYVILYLVAMIGILVYSFIRKENRHVYVSLYLSFLVAINIGIWLVESILKTRFEFLSVSYVISEILLIMFYSIVKKFIDAQNTPPEPIKTVEYFDSRDSQAAADEFAQTDLLSKREREVMKLLLEGKKRKEIAEELFVTESTIKKHSASIYKKLEVENRKELLEKVKSERINK